MSVEHGSPHAEQAEFSVEKTAEDTFRSVEMRTPGLVTPEEAFAVTSELAEGAKITTFIGTLAQGKLIRIASERSKGEIHTQTVTLIPETSDTKPSLIKRVLRKKASSGQASETF